VFSPMNGPYPVADSIGSLVRYLEISGEVARSIYR
jgi:hypothetical protein